MFIVLNPRLIVLWLTNLLPLKLEHRIPNMKNFQLPDVSFFQECVPYQGVYDSNKKKCLGGGNSNIFYVQPENWGR